jgi:hypothetical protein
MNQPQRNLRRAAAQAFMESLEQLQTAIQDSENPRKRLTPPSAKDSDSPDPASEQFDLQSFEQAVADIEEFIEKKSEP